ncbi:hypothetical protein QL285_015094 [Trifolium repens]|nr:hypothetical protein QL285_015094 [Trifolium repens]
MRERGRERNRDGGSRASLGHRRRHSWSAERDTRGERDFGRVPQTGGEEDEWTVVRRRGRKAFRQVDDDGDRLRKDQRNRRGVSPLSSRFPSKDRRQRFSLATHVSRHRDWRWNRPSSRDRSFDSRIQFCDDLFNNRPATHEFKNGRHRFPVVDRHRQVDMKHRQKHERGAHIAFPMGSVYNRNDAPINDGVSSGGHKEGGADTCGWLSGGGSGY